MTQLTEHFTFEEFTKTRHELLQAENRLQAEQYVDNMRLVAEEAVGKGMAFPNGNRGELDPIGNVANGEDRRHG